MFDAILCVYKDWQYVTICNDICIKNKSDTIFKGLFIQNDRSLTLFFIIMFLKKNWVNCLEDDQTLKLRNDVDFLRVLKGTF